MISSVLLADTSVAICILHNRVRILSCLSGASADAEWPQRLRLHRPFLMKGLESEKYAYSVVQCIASAEAICRALTDIVQARRIDAFWYMLGQALGAVIVLFIDQFYKGRRAVAFRVTVFQADTCTVWISKPDGPARSDPSIVGLHIDMHRESL